MFLYIVDDKAGFVGVVIFIDDLWLIYRLLTLSPLRDVPVGQ